ncbi:MAG: hypothetical protein NTZ17_09820 [Phycisphaerae bacterium]|nr:hypothetical protein [Phycisphaerae bacterium]
MKTTWWKPGWLVLVGAALLTGIAATDAATIDTLPYTIPSNGTADYQFPDDTVAFNGIREGDPSGIDIIITFAYYVDGPMTTLWTSKDGTNWTWGSKDNWMLSAQNPVVEFRFSGDSWDPTDWAKYIRIRNTANGGDIVLTAVEPLFPGRDPRLPPLPVANAGPDVSIYTSQESSKTLNGTASDPSPGPSGLTYRWLEGSTELKGPTAVGTDGSAPLALSTLVPLPRIGTHTLTLEVTDGQDTVSDTMVLTIANTPPEGQPTPTDQAFEIGVDPISVCASVADFDGDAVSYQWVKDGAVLASGVVTPPAGGAALDNVAQLTIPAGDTRFPLGSNNLQFVVDDGVNPAVTYSVIVRMQDTTAPTLAPKPSTTLLWPPNHQLVPVTIRAGDADNSRGNLVLTASIQSNENDGASEPDWYLDSIDNASGTVALRLRAERAGGSDGRVYTVTLTATDASGNQSIATVDIRVPHDKKK